MVKLKFMGVRLENPDAKESPTKRKKIVHQCICHIHQCFDNFCHEKTPNNGIRGFHF